MTATHRCVTDLFLPCSLQHLKVATSHYTEGTALPTSDECSRSAPPNVPQSPPPLYVIDKVALQQNESVEEQPPSHLSGHQPNTGELHANLVLKVINLQLYHLEVFL